MPSSVPDDWEMDAFSDHGPQRKRKQASSPAADTQVKKTKNKTPNTATSTTKTPTTSVSGSALITATRATEYACELVQSLADEFYSEDIIGPCLSKVVRALEQVCNALKLLDKDQRPPPVKKDASTATDPNIDIPAANASKPTTSSKPAGKTGQTANGNGRRRRNKKSKLDTRTPTANPPAQAKTTQPSEANSQPEKTQPEPEAAFTLVTNPKKNTNGSRPQSTRKTTQRPAAVLIKVGEGRTYADTLRQVRGTPIDFEGLGTHVTSMRKTLKGDLLVELTKGAKATAATATIRDRLAECIAGSTVTRLRHTADIEITDLDEVATREEVLAAIIKSAPDDQPLSADEVRITGLWATRDSRQMATATVPTAVSQRLTYIRVGWTQCRVRPRRPEPAKCYRCHGYGHGTRQCSGPDLSHACRRCGQSGHTEKTCTEGTELCVACDRIKAPRVPHKPGSGACAARRIAISEMNATRYRA